MMNKNYLISKSLENKKLMAKKTFLLFILAVSMASASEAGIRVSFGQQFFAELRQYALNNLQTTLNNVTVEPVDLDTSFWYIFHYGLKLTEPALEDVYFNVRQSNFTLNKFYQSVDIEISDVSLEYTANYSYTGTLIGSSTGSVTLKYSGATIKTRIVVDESRGKADAYLAYLEPDLKDLSIDIEADGWLLYILNGIGHTFPFDRVTNGIISALIRVIRWRLNSVVGNMVEDMKFDLALPLGLSLDYHLLDLLCYQDKYDDTILSAAVNATIFPTDSPQAQSIYKSYLPETWDEKNEGIRIQFGEYVINTLLWSLEYSNHLNYLVSNSTLPPDVASQVSLTVATLSFIIPQLPNRYPPNQLVQFYCYSKNAPTFDINPVVIEADIVGACKLQVPINSQRTDDVLTINFNLHEEFDLEIKSYQNGTYVYPYINAGSSQFSDLVVTDSIIGNVDLGQLSKAFEFVFIVFSRYANEYLFENGLRLPLPEGIHLNNAHFLTKSGYLEIGADVDLQAYAQRMFNDDY